MQRPVGKGQLQQPHQAVEGVVYCDDLAEIGEAKQGPKNGKVAAVQHEAAHSPQNQRHYLLHTQGDEHTDRQAQGQLTKVRHVQHSWI